MFKWKLFDADINEWEVTHTDYPGHKVFIRPDQFVDDREIFESLLLHLDLHKRVKSFTW